ncbi:MAG: DUF1501 domain-containing protein, partial [Pirellulaceae bacterium]|nr:DUF1501 domain-containing protein [Pirellulaceae bacterium]
ALAGLAAGRPVAAADQPLAERPGHHPPRARRIIFIFMQGGPSHVDTFDYKPELQRRDGQQVEFLNARTRQRAGHQLLGSPWKFQQHGQSGQWVSELFPHVARHVDDLCQVRGMHTEGVAHGPATLFLHTGATNLIRPSVGAWITYGLGSECEDLPGFVTISPSAGKGGPRNYSNAFLPTPFQGTAVGRAETPVSQARIRHITNDHLPPGVQRRQFDFLTRLNHLQLESRPGDEQLEATIASYELAFRMQNNAPGIMDLEGETAATRRLYGLDQPATSEFGRQCLLARRLAEAGVRYIQINYSDNSNNPRWDQHSNLKQHEQHALATDQPVAGLLADLKARGLLDDTLVWWGGEFGRTPFAQGRDGRDHNPKGFTVWLAGGGVRPGLALGATDEFGHEAVSDRVHMHDLHATLLHLLGLDHQRLTFRHAGRDFRLTDVHGRVVHEMMS